MSNKILPHFAYGSTNELNLKPVTPGTVYLLSDTKQLVVDTPTGSRVIVTKDYEERVAALESTLDGVEEFIKELLHSSSNE